MAGLFANRNRTAEDCIEIKYPFQVRVTALLLTIFAMLCYAMILLGYMPLYGLTLFVVSTLVLFSVIMLCNVSMNYLNWRIQVYGDRLIARKWNMTEKELPFSQLTAVWDPAMMDELRQMRGRAPGKKGGKQYCALVFGGDFIFVPMDNVNSSALVQRIRSYCEGEESPQAEKVRRMLAAMDGRKPRE
jgi:hypothetical protein